MNKVIFTEYNCSFVKQLGKIHYFLVKNITSKNVYEKNVTSFSMYIVIYNYYKVDIWRKTGNFRLLRDLVLKRKLSYRLTTLLLNLNIKLNNEKEKITH